MFATVATAAFRFLRPVVSGSPENWIDVAQVTELTGSKPLARKIVAEQVAGWAKSLTEHSVYILPDRNNLVLSAVCPHEGCEAIFCSPKSGLLGEIIRGVFAPAYC